MSLEHVLESFFGAAGALVVYSGARALAAALTQRAVMKLLERRRLRGR